MLVAQDARARAGWYRLACGLVAWSCGQDPKSSTRAAEADAPTALASFVPAPAAEPQLEGLPRAEDGTFILENAGELQLRYDPNPPASPITALAACLDWLMQCHDEVTRDLDACAAAVPRCASDRPWEEADPCCPETCVDQYAAQRTGGREALQAFVDVFGERLRCMPGYAAWLAGDGP